MALPPARKTAQRFRAPDSSIETLQDRLLKSLSTAFDPTAAAKSDDFFLAQDFSVSNYTESASDPYNAEKNPYKALVDRTKNFVEKAQAERPIRAKTAAAAVSTKKSDTFLTNVELEGNKRRNVVQPPPVEEEEVDDGLPQISYNNTLGDAKAMEQLDDLEELRKMIRQTKKEMGDYGAELLCLRRDILDATDIASKAGYGISQDLLRNIENTVNSLNNKNVYQHMMKNEGKAKLSKTLQPITEEEVKKKDAAPASFIVSKKSFSKGVRPSSYKGLRK